RATSASELPERIAMGWHVAASGEPGPVVLSVPRNVLSEIGEATDPLPAPPAPAAARDPLHDDKVARAAELVARAPRVGIYAGRGAFGAAAEIKALCETLEAPVATTVSGRGVLGDHHPLCVGYGYGLAGPGWIRHL